MSYTIPIPDGLAFTPTAAGPSGTNGQVLGDDIATNASTAGQSHDNSWSPHWGGSYAIKQDPTATGGSHIHIRSIAPNGFTYPNTTKRWCRSWSGTLRISALDSVDQFWWIAGLDPGDWGINSAFAGIWLKTTGKITLRCGLSTEVAGTATYSATTEYLFVLTAVVVSSALDVLVTPHVVLRTFTLNTAGSAPTLVETIHAYDQVPASPNHTLPYNHSISATSAIWLAHATSFIEDADNLSGARQVAWYKPNANGHADTGTWTANDFTKVDELPASSTNLYSDSGGNSGHIWDKVGLGASSTGADPATGSGDLILGVMVAVSGRANQGSKGATVTLTNSISDGTNTSDATNASISNGGANFLAGNAMFITNPAGTSPIVTADLTHPLQIGAKDAATGSGATAAIADYHGYVAWVKSGETLAAVPGPDQVATASTRRRGVVV